MSNNYLKTWPQIFQVCIIHRVQVAHLQQQEPVQHLSQINSKTNINSHKKVIVLSLERNHHNQIVVIYLLSISKDRVFRANPPAEDKVVNAVASVDEQLGKFSKI